MPYQHDVFISYKRQETWTPWVRDHFKKLLMAYLQQDLGQEPDIFVDERLIVGADWVEGLGTHLAASKVVVAIFSADYFGSDWCLHELDLMLARSMAASIGKPSSVNLIIPVVVHDGDLIPDEVKRILPVDMRKFRIACINDATSDYHEFSKAMGILAPQVAALIQTAPPFEQQWVDAGVKRFNRVFAAANKGKKLNPKNFTVKRQTPPLASPKLKI